MKTQILVLAILLNFSLSSAQNLDDSLIVAKVDALMSKVDSKVFKFGTSIACRIFVDAGENARATAYITPDDTLVRIEHGDKMSVVLSTSLSAFPFTKSMGFFSHLGFTININLVEFANNSNGQVFNKPVDGGLGVAYYFGPAKSFAFCMTYERIAIKRPTDYVIGKNGEKIIVAGQALTKLDKNDEAHYIDSGLNGVSFKFIYQF